MKPALSSNKPRYPRSWSELPAGKDLKHIVEASLEDVSRKMFGYHLVKIGDLSNQVDMPNCPIKHVINVSDRENGNTGIVAQSHELPLLENSVDAVVLAHELDFAQDPHQILREVDRILMPNGYVAIVGFSPVSVAGLLKYLPVNPKQILHDARFFTSTRIKDWLHLLGFEVIEHHNLLFSELFFERRINPFGRWQVWCRKYLPIFSSMYMIVAKKRVLPLSLIKARWKPKPKFSAVGASMRTAETKLLKKNLL